MSDDKKNCASCTSNQLKSFGILGGIMVLGWVVIEGAIFLGKLLINLV